jgi:SAM-dependent methyltransferase
MSTGRVDEIVTRFACPVCNASGRLSDGGLVCGAGHFFAFDDGIPVLLLDDAGAPDAHKRQQAEYFDTGASEAWEVERPRGGPQFHAWLLGEKFRRSIRGITSLLEGSSVLTVCGGSGMDGELLARAGSATVVVADISPEAAKRVVERSKRHHVELVPIVADVERLPFSDRSFDVVYVHDGLHHLEDPIRGLAEMMRVARRAISLTEPAIALATRIGVKFGWAATVEEAGNEVKRLRIRDVTRALSAAGFGIVVAERYGMYYAHAPGRASRLLSEEPLFTIARSVLTAANGVAGDAIGNKMTIQAVRGT